MNNYTKEDKFVELISKIPNVAVQGYNKDRVVIYWNKASEDVYGYTKEEAIGVKLEDLIIPDFMRDAVVAGIQNWYDNNIPIPTGELSLKHKDNSIVHVFSSHVMLKEDTQEPEMFCVDINLTEQKKQEQLLKEKDAILIQQSKMAAMGEMLEDIAHQWRQPLSMISATASSMKFQNEYDLLENDSLDSNLDSIMKNTHYLSQTIEDFRNFIKGEHIKIKFNVYDNIDYSLKLLKGVTNKNMIDIIFTCENKNIEILNYPNELIQVLVNIINNSKDAFKKDATGDKFIFVDLEENEDEIIIKIKDNANGIKQELITKIFEQYFTTKEKSKGTGIGLYMSQRLVQESMNGKISAKNTEYTYCDKTYIGALFEIRLYK